MQLEKTCVGLVYPWTDMDLVPHKAELMSVYPVKAWQESHWKERQQGEAPGNKHTQPFPGEVYN